MKYRWASTPTSGTVDTLGLRGLDRTLSFVSRFAFTWGVLGAEDASPEEGCCWRLDGDGDAWAVAALSLSRRRARRKLDRCCWSAERDRFFMVALIYYCTGVIRVLMAVQQKSARATILLCKPRLWLVELSWCMYLPPFKQCSRS